MNAATHFADKLRFETDPADVHEELEQGVRRMVVIDARTPEFYARGHVPGAINIPHRTITAESTAFLRQYELLVTYCDGIGCNASTKAALKLAELGFPVKEMIGGIDWWIRDGFPVATGVESGALAGAAIACGC